MKKRQGCFKIFKTMDTASTFDPDEPEDSQAKALMARPDYVMSIEQDTERAARRGMKNAEDGSPRADFVGNAEKAVLSV